MTADIFGSDLYLGHMTSSFYLRVCAEYAGVRGHSHHFILGQNLGTMVYQLRGHRVVVRADMPGERIGSIYVPEVARKQPLVGTVVLVGHRVTEVAPGDRVMFGHNAWSRWAPLGFPHMLLWERDLLCVLETT